MTHGKCEHRRSQHWGFVKEGESVTMVRVEDGLCPIFKKADGTFGFWDVDWVDSFGPFATWQECLTGVVNYSKTV